MNFKHIASFGIASFLLLGSVSATVVNPSIAKAAPSTSIQQANKDIISSGTFLTIDRGHATRGTAKIVVKDGQRYLQFDESFKTGRGPDVQVILHRTQEVPLNVNEENYVTLAPLQSFNGSQSYAIPADLDLNEFGAVAIWCRRFNVTFGAASLTGV